jgi:hypothetical protein
MSREDYIKMLVANPKKIGALIDQRNILTDSVKKSEARSKRYMDLIKDCVEVLAEWTEFGAGFLFGADEHQRTRFTQLRDRTLELTRRMINNV